MGLMSCAGDLCPGVDAGPAPSRCPGGAIAFDGHSILRGTLTTTKPPAATGTAVGKAVGNFAVDGSRFADCQSRWSASIQDGGFGSLVWLCGTNSLIDGMPGDVLWGETQPIVDSALDAGMCVVVGTETPMGDQYEPSVRANLAQYNALAVAWCDAAGEHARCADLHFAMAADGGYWNPTFEGPDHLHPNENGSLKMVDLFSAGLQ